MRRGRQASSQDRRAGFGVISVRMTYFASHRLSSVSALHFPMPKTASVASSTPN